MIIDNLTNMYNLTHFSLDSVASCISNVECSVGGNLELKQTILSCQKWITP
jgi:hypothetical protein